MFPINIENIEAFVYVIHCGSFNKAADALYLSQPSVTARIKSLEHELDCKLFDRQGKQIQITDDGKRFLPYAQQLLLIYQKGKQHINQKKSLPNEYRIGCTVSVSNYIIPDLLLRLKDKFPNTHYKLVTGTTDEIMNKVLNKEVDIGFVRNVNHPSLQSNKFYEDPIRLYVYEGHPFLTTENLTIGAIAEQPLVFLNAAPWIGFVFIAYLSSWIYRLIFRFKRIIQKWPKSLSFRKRVSVFFQICAPSRKYWRGNFIRFEFLRQKAFPCKRI